MFGNRIVALHHAVEWPSSSPDLTPGDFFLWGYLKSKLYTSPPKDIDDLRARILWEIAVLVNYYALVRTTVRSMRRHCELGIEKNG